MPPAGGIIKCVLIVDLSKLSQFGIECKEGVANNADKEAKEGGTEKGLI